MLPRKLRLAEDFEPFMLVIGDNSTFVGYNAPPVMNKKTKLWIKNVYGAMFTRETTADSMAFMWLYLKENDLFKKLVE